MFTDDDMQTKRDLKCFKGKNEICLTSPKPQKLVPGRNCLTLFFILARISIMYFFYKIFIYVLEKTL